MSDEFACGISECDCHLADDEISQADCLAKAREIGEANGKAGASWVFDGNTLHATYRSVVKMADDGDPALYDAYREPGFTGEYSDDYSVRDLADEIGIDYDATETSDMDEIADAYVDSARDAFWSEIERAARHAVTEVEQLECDARNTGWPYA